MGVSRHEVVAEVVSQQEAAFGQRWGVGLHFSLGTCGNDFEEINELAVNFADTIP